MGLFTSRRQHGSTGTRVDSSTNYREPIVGSRKVSWDNAFAGSRRGSEARTIHGGAAASLGLQPDASTQPDHSHSRQVSTGDQSMRSLRRKSYQTDTTTRSINAEARSVRVRASDVFRIKPELKFRQEVSYRTTPEGHLPTLRGGHSKSAFVDDLADELDTHQLRSVLDTDLRRRKRRQSALEEGGGVSRRHPSNLQHSGSRAIVPPLSVITDIRAGEVTFGRDSTDYIITGTTPVYDRFMEIKRKTSNVPVIPNSITGTSEFWHDPDSIQEPQTHPWKAEETGIILAGNRESFPDFAIVDRSNSIARQSTSSGILTTAWSSLWRRASTARAKKEIDVAQHRTKTLEHANDLYPISSETVTEPALQATHADRSVDRPLSASSSVLYETLDDLPRPIIRDVPEVANASSYVEVVNLSEHQSDEIPTDAFYDPNSTPRATSRATHSRNFSRPTNESRLGQYSSNQISIIKREHDPSKTFSPLLSGDSFPKPEQRDLSSVRPDPYAEPSNGHPDSNPPSRNEAWDSTYPLTPLINNNYNDARVTPGFSSPALAAGLPTLQPPGTSPTLPLISTRSNLQEDRYIPARALDYDNSWTSTPPQPVEADSHTLSRPGLNRGYTHESIDSMQSLDSEGSWLAKRRSDIDEIVRRSFSRNMNGRPSSSSTGTSGLGRPIRPSSTASHLRYNDVADRSDSESSSETEDARVLDGESDSDTHPDTPTDDHLMDDAEYEQGIWRTGIGRSVQVISSSLDEGRPVVMDRAELPSATHSRQTSKDMSEYGSTNESKGTGNLQEEPPHLVNRDSFLASTASFHTAAVYSGNTSAATSRSTINGQDY